MELQDKRVLIVGGYGLVGSHIARLIRKDYRDIKLILAGRNPENGEPLVNELSNANTAYLNLDEGFDLSAFGKIDLIITAMDDHANLLRETAILNKIAIVTVSEVASQIAPTAFLGLHKQIYAPVVFAGHWQAGILTLVVKQLAGQFDRIIGIETAGLYDEKDPIGPLVASQVSDFLGQALLRKDGKWLFVDAKDNARKINLHNHTYVTGYPMGTLDVPSIAAFTSAKNVRFDFARGVSIGTASGLEASHDLYIDIEGVSSTGEQTKICTIVSAPKGNAHLTAVGVFLITEAILSLKDKSIPKKGGLYLPETIISDNDIISRLTEFGIRIMDGEA